jgi:hypothetical protein
VVLLEPAPRLLGRGELVGLQLRLQGLQDLLFHSPADALLWPGLAAFQERVEPPLAHDPQPDEHMAPRDPAHIGDLRRSRFAARRKLHRQQPRFAPAVRLPRMHLINARRDFRHAKFEFYSSHLTLLPDPHPDVTLFVKDGIILHPVDGYELKSSFHHPALSGLRNFTGMHTYDRASLFIRSRKWPEPTPRIVDLAPFILRLMDLPVPNDLDSVA